MTKGASICRNKKPSTSHFVKSLLRHTWLCLAASTLQSELGRALRFMGGLGAMPAEVTEQLPTPRGSCRPAWASGRRKPC